MLAINILRYWWLNPQIADPRHSEQHDPLLSSNIPSILEPTSAPQFESRKEWSKIPHFYGGANPKQRSLIEIERELAEGKDLILVEPEMAAQVYYHYIAHGWLLQESTMLFGSVALFFSYFLPRWWLIYVPCTFLALMHSYVYFRVYKYDRLSQYQAYDDDKHPVSNLVTAWVLGQRPDHFQYVLKKQRVWKWEIISECMLYSALYSTLKSLADIETHVLGGSGTLHLKIDPNSLSAELLNPAFESGYFRPPDLVQQAARFYLPSDIPMVSGWFDLPFLNFRPKPMKGDLALIIAGLGAYFLFKGFQHFFLRGDGEDEEVDEVGREWIRTEEEKKEIVNEPIDPQWVIIKEEEQEDVYDTVQSKSITELEKKLEQEEVTRITSQVPYGWVPPGYPEDHYGIFT